jgi:hypothetical protein
MKMLARRKPLPARSAVRPAVGEMVLITTIAIVFLVLHVLAGHVVQRAAADPVAPARQDARPSSYD